MAECIQNSLRYDISKEKEKKKKIPVPKDHISKGSNSKLPLNTRVHKGNCSFVHFCLIVAKNSVSTSS